MITTPYERIMITVRFRCGCEGIISEFRTPETEKQSRYREDVFHLCKNCLIKSNQTEERYAAMPHDSEALRYMVDGHAMVISKDKEGYWRGWRNENGKRIKKYFGRMDPRPLLEEVPD